MPYLKCSLLKRNLTGNMLTSWDTGYMFSSPIQFFTITSRSYDTYSDNEDLVSRCTTLSFFVVSFYLALGAGALSPIRMAGTTPNPPSEAATRDRSQQKKTDPKGPMTTSTPPAWASNQHPLDSTGNSEARRE